MRLPTTLLDTRYSVVTKTCSVAGGGIIVRGADTLGRAARAELGVKVGVARHVASWR